MSDAICDATSLNSADFEGSPPSRGERGGIRSSTKTGVGGRNVGWVSGVSIDATNPNVLVTAGSSNSQYQREKRRKRKREVRGAQN